MDFLRSLIFVRCLFGLVAFSLSNLVRAEIPQVKDPKLAQCIAQAATKYNWTKAEEVTSLVCHNKKISTLDGIEYFSSLEKLSLHKNAVEAVELPRLPNLRMLNLGRNRLDELKVEGLPKLEQLYVFGNNLTRLELIDLPALILLKGNNNKLTQLQYKGLPAVEKMHIFDNQLETIDIYNLPSLVYMDCRQNPMPDPLYDEMDAMEKVTFHHDGNAEDW